MKREIEEASHTAAATHIRFAEKLVELYSKQFTSSLPFFQNFGKGRDQGYWLIVASCLGGQWFAPQGAPTLLDLGSPVVISCYIGDPDVISDHQL